MSAIRWTLATLLLVAGCKGAGEPAPSPAPAPGEAPPSETSTDEASPNDPPDEPADEPTTTAAAEPGAPAATAPRVDPAVLVTPAALAEELQGDAPVVIDVRGEAPWASGHLAGALPIAPYALATSAPVRAGRVVVVDEGWGARAVDEVTALRAAGRDVRLLDGGIARWCREGRPVDGTCAGVDRIPAASVVADLSCGDRVTLVAVRQTGAIARAEALLPGARTVVWSSPAEVAKAAAAAGTPRTLVVVDEDGAAADALLAALPASLPLVLMADGGLEAVDRIRQVQRAAEEHPALVTRGVPAAQASRGAIRTPKGCGCR